MTNKTYQIQIALKHIQPKIWRRILIPSDLLLSDFHEVIQISMGWSDSHLHHFIKNKKFYTVRLPDDDLWGEMNNVDYSGMRVSDLLMNENEKIIYEYDFGDSWEHEVILEKILPKDRSIMFAKCIGGKMKCPPDDCGGASGYAEMLEILKQPKHKEYKSYKKWLGGEFDPKEFNKDDLTFFLQDIAEYKQFQKEVEDGHFEEFDEEFDDEFDNELDNEFQNDLTYSDILLDTKTKAQIIDLGNSFGLKMKTSDKKTECAKFVESALINQPQIIKNVLSYNELAALKIILDNNESEAGLTLDDIEGLFAIGFLNISLTLREKDPDAIPKNIKSAIDPLLDSILSDPALQRNYKLENLIIGIVTLYGAVPINKMVELVNKYQDEVMEKRELIEFLNSASRIQRRIFNKVLGGTSYLIYTFMSDPDSFVQEVSERKEIDYFVFTKAEIDNASKAYYYFNNNQIDKIKILIMKNGFSDFDLFFHKIWFDIQNEVELSETISFIESYYSFDNFAQIQKILHLVTEYSNNIPKWILKGNTSLMIHEKMNGKQPNTQSNKLLCDYPYDRPILSRQVGRNDACPCGSGKKYKHCCDNN